MTSAKARCVLISSSSSSKDWSASANSIAPMSSRWTFEITLLRRRCGSSSGSRIKTSTVSSPAATAARSEKRRQAAHDTARAAHEKKYTAFWVEYLRTQERIFRTTRIAEYGRFESERDQRRAEIKNSRWKTLSATILETFDAEETLLREFHEFFSPEIFDFWTWDRKINQEAFTTKHVTV